MSVCMCPRKYRCIHSSIHVYNHVQDAFTAISPSALSLHQLDVSVAALGTAPPHEAPMEIEIEGDESAAVKTAIQSR